MQWDNDNAPYLGELDVNAILRDLMDVAKVGIGNGTPQLPKGEAIAMLALLLELIDDRMPDALQRQDNRVQQGRALRDLVVGLPAFGAPRRR